MDFSDTSFEHLPLAAKRRIDAVCERFERDWRAGARPRLESFCTQVPGDEQAILFGELLHVEVEFRRRAGEIPVAEDYLDRFPSRAEVIRSVFSKPVPFETSFASQQSATQPAAAVDPALPQVPGYEVYGELGRGGMGVVYKARHLKLNRMVALKFILTGPDAPERHKERFRREAELVAHLRHPNIVQIYDVGEANGQVYLALEYADGGNLRDRQRGPMEPRAAVQMMEPLARALQHAHRRGVIHRDVKPANVLLTVGGDSISASSGLHLPDWEPPADVPVLADLAPPLWTCTPKLTDFGLARLLHTEPPPGEPNLAVGTPSYMAPEQATGAEPGPAVDVWALGATLYELLTGRPPFKGGGPAETLRDVLMLDPAPPSQLRPSVPRDLDTICLKCLQKDPAQRYAGARELAQDLRSFLAGESIAARPAGGAIERLARWARKRPTLAAVFAGAVLLAVAGAAAVAGALIYARLR
jgi:serine/threonine protein kinase